MVKTALTKTALGEGLLYWENKIKSLKCSNDNDNNNNDKIALRVQ